MLLLALTACTPNPISVPGPGAAPADGTLEIRDIAASSGYDDFDLSGHFQRGRGCTWADFDGDGDVDVFLANPADASYVLRNITEPGGPIRFEPGKPVDRVLPWAGAAADYDNDGDVDLFVGVGGLEGVGFDLLLRNDAGLFTDVTQAAGVSGPASRRTGEPAPIASTGVSFVDVDRDGQVDLYVDGHVFPITSWSDLPEDTVVGYSVLWHNQGDGTFVDIAADAGLTHQAPHRFSAWLDVDQDGDDDLYENNWSVAHDVFWRNLWMETGEIRFEEATLEWSLGGADLRYPLESFAAATEDVNNDGWPDLLVYVRGWPTEGPHLAGHTLFLNVEGHGFVDATVQSNLNDPFDPGYLRDHLSLGVMGNLLADVNGDGLPDVYIGNGGPVGGYPDQLFLTTGLERHVFEGVSLAGAPPRDIALMVPIFENVSTRIDFPSEERPGVGPYPPYPYRTHAVCAGDLDGDGQLEIGVSEGGMSWFGGTSVQEPNRLFQVLQDPAPRWLSVDVRGDPSIGTDALGTVVSVTVSNATDVWTVRRTVRTTNGFAAQNPHALWFGLNDAERIASVEVLWPDGRVDRPQIEGLDRRIVVTR